MSKQQEILPGMKVKCQITGYVGIVDHVSTYMHSGNRVAIQPSKGKDGKLIDAIGVDAAGVVILDAKRIVDIELPEQIYQFGQKAEDPITGFKGTITGRAVYLNGCARVALEPELHKGEMQDAQWFNETRLKPVGKLKTEEAKPVRTGGPNLGGMRRDTSFR